MYIHKTKTGSETLCACWPNEKCVICLLKRHSNRQTNVNNSGGRGVGNKRPLHGPASSNRSWTKGRMSILAQVMFLPLHSTFFDHGTCIRTCCVQFSFHSVKTQSWIREVATTATKRPEQQLRVNSHTPLRPQPERRVYFYFRRCHISGG